VCQIAQALLGRSSEPALKTMRCLAHRRPQLARVLLLPALLSCLEADPTSLPFTFGFMRAVTRVCCEAQSRCEIVRDHGSDNARSRVT
jgi:hypothetical protein